MSETVRPEKDVTPELAAAHGINPEEYERVRSLLGRTPTYTELGIFSLMWSEHCSYKSSRAHLRRLPTTRGQVIQGPGENAGAIDIGNGLAAVFKMRATTTRPTWSPTGGGPRGRGDPPGHLHHG